MFSFVVIFLLVYDNVCSLSTFVLEYPELSMRFNLLKEKDIEGTYIVHSHNNINNSEQLYKGNSILKIRTYNHKNIFIHLSLYNGKYRNSFSTIEHNIPYEHIFQYEIANTTMISFIPNTKKINANLFRKNLFFTTSVNTIHLSNITFAFGNDDNKIQFNLSLDNHVIIENNFHIRESSFNYKITIFLLISQLCTVSYLFSCLYLIFQIKSNKINKKHLSITTLNINSLLNAGSILIYANLSTQLEYDLSSLKINAFLSFFTLVFGETALTYILRQSDNMNIMNIVKYLIEEIMYIIIAFLCLFWYSFGHVVFMILLSITFAFQILHNYKYKINKNSLPIYFIVILTLNKLFFPLTTFLFGYELFKFPRYIGLFIFECIVHLFQITILYLQIKNGYLFYIPLHKRNVIYKYVVSLDEFIHSHINTKPFEGEHCSICLKKLFSDIPCKAPEKEYMKVQIETNSNKKETPEKNILNSIKRKSVYSINKLNKNECLIITPCNHIFHYNCIAGWWKQKRECPICRHDLPLLEWDTI